MSGVQIGKCGASKTVRFPVMSLVKKFIFFSCPRGPLIRDPFGSPCAPYAPLMCQLILPGANTIGVKCFFCCELDPMCVPALDPPFMHTLCFPLCAPYSHLMRTLCFPLCHTTILNIFWGGWVVVGGGGCGGDEQPKFLTQNILRLTFLIMS